MPPVHMESTESSTDPCTDLMGRINPNSRNMLMLDFVLGATVSNIQRDHSKSIAGYLRQHELRLFFHHFILYLFYKNKQVMLCLKYLF